MAHILQMQSLRKRDIVSWQMLAQATLTYHTRRVVLGKRSFSVLVRQLKAAPLGERKQGILEQPLRPKRRRKRQRNEEEKHLSQTCSVLSVRQCITVSI